MFLLVKENVGNFLKDASRAVYKANHMKKFLFIILAITNPLFVVTSLADDYVVTKVEIEEADAITNRDARVLFIDTDGDRTNIEKITFEFEELLKYKEKINNVETPVRQTFIKAIELDSVFVKHVTEVFDYKPDSQSVRYYISGPGTAIWSNSRTADVPYEQSRLVRRGRTEKSDKVTIEVTQRVFDYLKEILGNQMPIREWHVTEDGDLNYDIEMGLYDY